MKRVVDALTTFQVGLVTRAPFDDFLLGDDKALSAEQLKGAMVFDQKNCSACHTGPAIGGQMIQIAGINKPWPNQQQENTSREMSKTRNGNLTQDRRSMKIDSHSLALEDARGNAFAKCPILPI